MKQVVLASLLVAASAASLTPFAFAQDAAPAAPAAPAGQAAAPAGQVTLSQEEYNAYQAGVTATTPAAKAAAFEAYLKQYPNSTLKVEALNAILFADSQMGDQAKTLDAADRLLAVDPTNLRALTFEVYYGRADADKLTDPAAKQAALDKVAGFAQRGLSATAPKGMSDADFQTLKKRTTPVFESAIADDDMSKDSAGAEKDNAGAITALNTEITSADPGQLTTVGPVLQDEYTLANAYYTSTPPDYLDCAWYATRAGADAPPAGEPPLHQRGTYCYAKYHGAADENHNLNQFAHTNIKKPADLGTTITPAPKPADLVRNLIAGTPDLATLALSDKEFVLQYGEDKNHATEKPDTTGKPDPATGETYADQVFDSIKGKSVEIPGAIVVAATPDQLQVSVSQDAVQGKTADFTFNMKTPLTKVPAVGETVTLNGTYTSYTQKPLMITMSDASVVEPKKPATHTTTRRH